jgi:hypothetical protein
MGFVAERFNAIVQAANFVSAGGYAVRTRSDSIAAIVPSHLFQEPYA